MISANNVTLRVGKKALFEDVNIKFTEGNCYGMIGANGAGKSTFLKILSGQIEPTKGEVNITPGERLSFLQQDHYKYDEYMVLDTVIMGNARLYEIMKEKDVIYAKEDFTDEDGIKASELEGEFATMNGWEAESDAENLLKRSRNRDRAPLQNDERPPRRAEGQGSPRTGVIRQPGYPAPRRADQPPGSRCDRMARGVPDQL